MIEFTAFYLIFVFCFIFPPSAFVSAGITISNLFDSWLGSEDLQFVQYHLARTLTTVVIHSLLPLGFFGGVLLVEGLDQLLSLVQTPLGLGFLCLSALLPVIAAAKVFSWWTNNWNSHPLVVSLTVYATNGRHWNDVASEINAEFRRIDKVTVRTNPVSKTVITSSWIIKVEPYAVRVAHQNHVTLELENAEEHDYTPDSQTTQYLWVKVEQLQTRKKLFSIRLNAMDYADMQNRLQRSISNVRGLLINQDIHARFSKVFIEEVSLNPVFQTQEEMDSCLGCGVNNANVRLVRRCLPSEATNGCTPCFCRPMWCIHCLSKWFSARQDAEHPETWLSSRCPCPTCRSPFCVLDVSLVENVQNM